CNEVRVPLKRKQNMADINTNTMFHPQLESITVSQIVNSGISSADALTFHEKLQSILKQCGGSRALAWNVISKILLRPDHPFSLHQLMYYGCYADWDAAKNGPPPAWTPSLENAMSTNIGNLLQRRGSELLGSAYTDPIASFPRFYKLSIENPEVYWDIIYRELDISFSVLPSRILHVTTSKADSESFPGGVWLPGAMLNIAENCLVSNSKKKPNDVAIIWQDEGKNDLPLNVLTFEELRLKVCQVANALDTLCLPKGSAIAIDMPMVITAVIIYLALVLAGYVVVSIADSFVSREISTRLKISNAKAIFTQALLSIFICFPADMRLLLRAMNRRVRPQPYNRGGKEEEGRGREEERPPSAGERTGTGNTETQK
ncbi:hypothetical protein KI387_008090, partial [Taxus chinensis]